MTKLPSEDEDQVPLSDRVDQEESAETISISSQTGFAPGHSNVVQGEYLEAGASFGRFQLIRVLGRGGMGIVYLANDPKLRRQVALKVMRPEVLSQPIERERFLREARAAASLSSDHVVVIYEADEIDGVPYIAQQLLSGSTLDDYQNQHPNLSPETILRFAKETLSGLSVAHKAGMVHRDIKPSNLWIESPADRIKILDFGLALCDHGDKTLTQRGSLLGTPSYMSPEQALGKEVDSSSDLFSVGVVLYRLCVGKLPFVGDSAIGVLHSILHEEPVAVHLRNETIPLGFSNFIAKLLRKNRSDRFTSAVQALAELDTIDSTGIPPASMRQSKSKPRQSWQNRRIAVAAAMIAVSLFPCLFFFNAINNPSELDEFRDARALMAALEKTKDNPNDRVSITYDVEVGDETLKIDPPFIIGVFANLRGHNFSGLKALQERKFVEIDRDNFEAVMKAHEPVLSLTVPDRLDETGTRNIELTFGSMSDFEPTSVANRIPDIAQLIQVRKSASSQANASQSRITAIDTRISSQLREVFQHPDFRRLESTWRGLQVLTFRAPTGSHLKIRVLNTRKKELLDDVLLAENSSQTNAFRMVIDNEYGIAGGQPFALLIADYEIGNESDEVYFLSSLGKVAEYAGAPIILPVSPSMFGLANFADLNAKSLESIKFGSEWQHFRESPEAKFVGLTLPRFVARLPYSPQTNTAESFVFYEPRNDTATGNINLDDFVWMSGVWPFALEVAEAYGHEGWPARCSGEMGGGKIDYLPELPSSSTTRQSTDTLLSQPLQLSLIRSGFMPFDQGGPGQPTMLLRAQSCGKDSRLNELLCAASYLRVIRMIARDKVGSLTDSEEMTRFLQSWLDYYCIENLAGATAAERRLKPLLDASLTVSPSADSPGVAILHLKVRPHYLFDPPPQEPIEFKLPIPVASN